MIYIWVMIIILFLMLETLQPQYNYFCLALGALLGMIVHYFTGSFLFEFFVFFFSGTGFILWLKPKFHFYQEKDK